MDEISRRRAAAAAALAGCLAASAATAKTQAAALYFDPNGAIPGSGIGALGGTYTWDLTTAAWSPDPAGASAALQAWDPAATAVFSAGADATGSILVNVRGVTAAAGIIADEGTVTIGPLTGSIALNGGAFDVPAAGRVLTLKCAVAGTSFTETGPGTLSLTHAASTFTAGFAVTGGGVVQVADENGAAGGSPSRTGTIPAAPVPDFVRLDGGTLQSTGNSVAPVFLHANKGIFLGAGGGTLSVADTVATNPHTYAGAISGTGALTKAGPGMLLLGGGPQASTFTGPLAVNQGTLRLAGNNVLPAGTPLSVAAGATLDLGGHDQTVGALSGSGKILTPGRLTVAPAADTTWAGVISVSGGLTATGPAYLVLAAAQAYAGPTIISGSSATRFGIRLGTAGALPTGPDLQFYAADPASAPTFDLNGFPQTLANVTNLHPGVGHPTITNTAATLATLTLNNQPAPVDVPITGAIALTKAGTSTALLAATNTYTGPTRVTGGILAVSAASQLGDGGPANGIVLDGGTLRTDGPVSTSRALSAAPAGGTVDTNGSDATVSGPVTGAGTLTKAGAGTLTLGPLSLAGLAVSAGQVRLAPGAGTSTLATLTVAGGAKFDAADNRLVLTGLSPAAVASLLAAGRVGASPGDWQGAAGIGSSSAAADPGRSTAIGYAAAAQLGVTTWGTATGLTGSETLTEYTYYGDLNLDGRIDADDYAQIDRSTAKGGLAGAAAWIDGDVNYDRAVTAADYLLMDRAFALHGGALSPQMLAGRESMFGAGYVADLVASVPEPTAAATVATVTLLLSPMRRRRRR